MDAGSGLCWAFQEVNALSGAGSVGADPGPVGPISGIDGVLELTGPAGRKPCLYEVDRYAQTRQVRYPTVIVWLSRNISRPSTADSAYTSTM